jgi:cytochrome P450
LNIRSLVDNSILTLDGEAWHKLRKMFNPAFAQAQLDSLIPQMVTETLVFVGTLDKAAKQGTTVLMLEELMVMTISLPFSFLELYTRHHWICMFGSQLWRSKPGIDKPLGAFFL